MKFKTFTFVTLSFFCFLNYSRAQDKSPVKFGKVSVEDFDLSKYKFDAGAGAVVIADIGSSHFEGNNKGWFTLIFKHEKRIKIINKNGFDAAKIEIPLYSDGREEENLVNLKATTYNLENGEIVKSDLENSSVFKDKLSKNVVNKKFTFPAVKEGSIIEYSYTINSDFLFNLQPWEFQGAYPRIWSEYTVSIPDFFYYVSLSQGYQSYFIKNNSQNFQSFSVIVPGGVQSDERFSINSNIGTFRWVMKDVPVLKEEPFTTTLDNHISKIEFQLSQYRFPNVPAEDILGDWFKVSDKMLKRDDFGAALSSNNNWLGDDIKSIVAGAANDLEKVKKIYVFVRDNFTCTDYSDLYLNNSLKTIFKNRNGSVADINLLLIAMLNHENIKSAPLILSTREHGYANDMYPLMNRFNYVIADVKINDSTIYLDASHPTLGFGKLSVDVYNGYARLIDKTPILINFSSDSLAEKKVTLVLINNNDKGQVEGTLQTTPGYYESESIRRRIKDKGESNFFKKVKSSYGSDIEISDTHVDSLESLDNSVFIHYDLKLNNMNDDIIYFNPMLSEGYKDNFLKAAERKYPVEMPYTFDETYILNMEVPSNYVIDEIPKSAKVTYNDNEGYFEYIISKTDTEIQLRSRVVLKKANFLPEDYNSLRDFFGFVVKKHSEQIVFKKKK